MAKVEGVEVEVGLIFVEEMLEEGRMTLPLTVVEELFPEVLLIHEQYMVQLELTNWDQILI